MVSKQIIGYIWIYMGIRISGKTDNPKTLKLLNTLCSFSFEQQYGEMSRWDDASKNMLARFIKKLSKLV